MRAVQRQVDALMALGRPERAMEAYKILATIQKESASGDGLAAVKKGSESLPGDGSSKSGEEVGGSVGTSSDRDSGSGSDSGAHSRPALTAPLLVLLEKTKSAARVWCSVKSHRNPDPDAELTRALNVSTL